MDKIIWIIIAIWTAGDRNDLMQFTNVSFSTKKECVEYVKVNYLALNNYVNKEYISHPDTPNIFYCTTPSEWQNFLK